MSQADIRIVLVETSHPGNIGAAARAMKTMGLTRLFLVRPFAFPSEEAETRAVGAADIVQGATVCADLHSAIADCKFVIGGSARPRELPLPTLDARQAGSRIAREVAEGNPVAILFGTERNGLSNLELDACSHRLQIPTNPDFKSLNLAAAVQLVCYEILMAAPKQASEETGDAIEPSRDPTLDPTASSTLYPTMEEMEFFYRHMERTLAARDFSGAVNPDKINAKLRRFIGRARPTANELNLLHSLVRLMRDESGD